VHEQAHVRRFDDWGRLAQVLVQAFAGWHPAVAWASRSLEIEREAACDDFVIATDADRAGYARVLAGLAEASPCPGRWSMVPGLGSATRRLRTRLTRLLDSGQRRGTSTSAPVFVLWSTGLIALSFLLGGLQFVPVPPDVAQPLLATAPAIVTLGQAPAVPSSRELRPLSGPGAGSRSNGREMAAARLRAAGPWAARVPASDVPAAAPAVPRGTVLPRPLRNMSDATTLTPRPAVGLTSDSPEEPWWRKPSGPATTARKVGLRGARRAASAEPAQTPWGAAAVAGVSIGTGARRAAVKTAGLFARLGKSVAGAF
jgi:BlaR1 peptidase M56